MISGVFPFDGLFRYHVAGTTVICRNYPTRRRHTFRDFGVWQPDENLPPCPLCNGILERNRYLVDLSEFGGNGQCTCEHFDFRLRPRARDRMGRWNGQGKIPEQLRKSILEEPLRCHHLEMARQFFADVMIQHITQKQNQNHESNIRQTAVRLAYIKRG